LLKLKISQTNSDELIISPRSVPNKGNFQAKAYYRGRNKGLCSNVGILHKIFLSGVAFPIWVLSISTNCTE